MLHGHFKGDPRPQAGFLENHGKGFPGQEGWVAAGPVLFFELEGETEEFFEFVGGVVGDVEEVLHVLKGPFFDFVFSFAGGLWGGLLVCWCGWLAT
jgi:hypothetical protein